MFAHCLWRAKIQRGRAKTINFASCIVRLEQGNGIAVADAFV
jgi:hypothetical protein